MKLTNEIKACIDKYFDNVSAEELYDVLTNKYNMPDAGDFFEQGDFFSSTNMGTDMDSTD